MIYRIYTEDKNREAILEAADRYLKGWTAFLTIGGWEQHHEPSIVIEYYVSKGSSGWAEGHACVAFAHFIKQINEQQRVDIIKIQESELIVI